MTIVPVKTIGFSGTVLLIRLGPIKWPDYGTYERDGQPYVAADGYSWLKLFPEHAHYTVTAIYDERSRLVRHIVSVCKSQGVSDGGVPWYDDLYLKLMAVPDGPMYLIGEERLEEAVRRGELSESDAGLARKTAGHVLAEYRRGSFDLLLMADKHMRELTEGEGA